MKKKDAGKTNEALFQDGANAFLRGRDLMECPYAQGTEACLNWEDGWLAESEVFDVEEGERR